MLTSFAIIYLIYFHRVPSWFSPCEINGVSVPRCTTLVPLLFLSCFISVLIVVFHFVSILCFGLAAYLQLNIFSFYVFYTLYLWILFFLRRWLCQVHWRFYVCLPGAHYAPCIPPPLSSRLSLFYSLFCLVCFFILPFYFLFLLLFYFLTLFHCQMLFLAALHIALGDAIASYLPSWRHFCFHTTFMDNFFILILFS